MRARSRSRFRPSHSQCSIVHECAVPSPVSGRGSRLFSLVHILVHLTSVILSIALLAEGLDHAGKNSIENDGAALVLSTILLIAGVVTTVWLSLSSVKPFEEHGLTLAAMLFCFLCALALKIFAFSTFGSTLGEDHNARVVALLGFISESAGISLLFAAFVVSHALPLTTASPPHRLPTHYHSDWACSEPAPLRRGPQGPDAHRHAVGADGRAGWRKLSGAAWRGRGAPKGSCRAACAPGCGVNGSACLREPLFVLFSTRRMDLNDLQQHGKAQG